MDIGSDRTIRFWGALDLAFFGWYVAFSIGKGHIPFWSELTRSAAISDSFGLPVPTYITGVGLLLYASFAVSGILLAKAKKPGVILSYVQLPFRLLSASPSIFFVLWPLKYIFAEPPVTLGIGLVLASEAIKVFSTISWQRRVVATGC